MLASAWLGTALLTLAYGWASYADCRAAGCLLLAALLLAGLVAWLAVRRGLASSKNSMMDRPFSRPAIQSRLSSSGAEAVGGAEELVMGQVLRGWFD